ncbi:GNAT family N-acetyltransferase [Gordonia sp. NPDC003504]
MGWNLSTGWTFRRLTRADFVLLGEWLADPEVARWWCHDSDPAAVERDFGAGVDGDEPGENLIAEIDGRAAGLVQRSRVGDYSEDEAHFRRLLPDLPVGARTLDYLVGAPADRGHGVGAAMIDAAACDAFDRYPDTPCVVVAVVAANRRSWRACERAGFRIVATGDIPPDNPIDDPRHHILRRDRGDHAEPDSCFRNPVEPHTC